eukprot:g2321.t1
MINVRSCAWLFATVFVVAHGAHSVWEEDSAAPNPKDEIVVTVALKQEGIPAMLQALTAASDPTNPHYGQHWSVAQMNERVFAPALAHRRVVAWLTDSGAAVLSTSPNRALIDARFQIATAERAFGLRLRRFVHRHTGATCIRAARVPGQRPAYTLPRAVAALVDVVDGLTDLPPGAAREWAQLGEPGGVLHSEAAAAATGSSSSGKFKVTPASLKARYGVDDGAVPRSAANLQAVVSFLGQYFSPEDLAAFQDQNGLQRAPVSRVVGPQNGSNPGVEAELDVQFLSGVANGTDTMVWSTGGERAGGNEPFLTWLHALEQSVNASQTALPNVLSISYQDYEDTVDPAFMTRVSVEFAKLGLMGATVVTGSGDWGVGCSGSGRFRPDFPSSSPYIVSTGATTLAGDGSAADAEVGVTFSSGGFSDHFSMPAIQRDAVAAFLQQSKVPAAKFNASGRAFPDVSALGVNFQVVYQGRTISVGGTSAATPTFAAVVSLLNDVRLSMGKSPMGYILPFLYHAATVDKAAFTDVTSGNNAYGACSGFDCAPGWDPMTGLGTPNFPTLVKLATSLP